MDKPRASPRIVGATLDQMVLDPLRWQPTSGRASPMPSVHCAGGFPPFQNLGRRDLPPSVGAASAMWPVPCICQTEAGDGISGNCTAFCSPCGPSTLIDPSIRCAKHQNCVHCDRSDGDRLLFTMWPKHSVQRNRRISEIKKRL